MFFLRAGNGHNLMTLKGTHHLYRGSGTNWALLSWYPTISGVVVDREPVRAMTCRDFGLSGIIPPPQSLSVVISTMPGSFAPMEVAIFSSVVDTSFYYKELVVSLSAERIDIAGFGQRCSIEILRSSDGGSSFGMPLSLPAQISSLEDLRLHMKRCPSGVVERPDGRGYER